MENACVLFYLDTLWFFRDIDSVLMAIFDFTYVVNRRTDIFQARTERETMVIPGDMSISVSRDAIEFDAPRSPRCSDDFSGRHLRS